MTWNHQAFIRLGLIGLVGVILQLTTISQLHFFGISADLSPLLVAAVGIYAGSIAGAVFGFCVGLFVDIALLQVLGVSSLVLAIAGYGAGNWQILREPNHPLALLGLGALSTAIAAVGFALAQFLLGAEAPVSGTLLQQILVLVLINALVAIPICRLVKRILRPCLANDRRRRRRIPNAHLTTSRPS